MTTRRWPVIAKSAIRLFLLAAWGGAFTAHAELPVEEVTVSKLPPAHAQRLYLTDVALPHLVDGKLTVIDGRTLKVEGMVSTGMFAQTTLSPDRSEIYVATTYYSKLNRGERIEEILVYDAKTLALKEEIPYPARHAQALPYRGTLRTTADGRFILVQNATPATSVSVVNRQTGKHVTEIQTPGCYILYPAQTANRFSTLCGDGTMLTVSLDSEGLPISKKKSVKFFDPDGDALFVSAAQEGNNYHFVSFKGHVVTVNVGGETAVAGAFWRLGNDADAKMGWRPSGYQPLALHKDSGTLYVGMHPNGFEGSHKDSALEIWVYDLATQRRVARTKTPPASGLVVSQGSSPRLYAFDSGKAGIIAFEGGRKLKQLGLAIGFGDSPTQLEVQ
jgi:methylamine dehydrogenase heavy chain